MFYSAKQYHDYLVRTDSVRAVSASSYDTGGGYANGLRRFYEDRNGYAFRGRVTLKHTRAYLKALKKDIADRTIQMSGSRKFARPWSVVPALAQFTPPVGDFGIGVEVEMGFNSHEDAQFVAKHIANWHNVAIDYEGGEYPIEATFKPFLLSKMNKNTQALRYLDFLKANSDRVVNHSANRMVGTHINVSMGGARLDGQQAFQPRVRLLSSVLATMTGVPNELGRKYFGRQPYGYCNLRGNGRYVEYKLFNSQLDSKRLKQYINIAVELTRLLADQNVVINHDTVLAALEAGYNKKL